MKPTPRHLACTLSLLLLLPGCYTCSLWREALCGVDTRAYLRTGRALLPAGPRWKAAPLALLGSPLTLLIDAVYAPVQPAFFYAWLERTVA